MRGAEQEHVRGVATFHFPDSVQRGSSRQGLAGLGAAVPGRRGRETTSPSDFGERPVPVVSGAGHCASGLDKLPLSGLMLLLPAA